MKIFMNPEREQWESIAARPILDNSQLMSLVSDVFTHVKNEGNEALKYYTKEFDGVENVSLIVPETDIANSGEKLSATLREAIQTAAGNIRRFHEAQKYDPIEVETTTGVLCRQKSVPIESVGLYIPGGTAPLFSTVLMLAIPACIAECKNIVLCTPPSKDGSIDPAILYAAKISGVKNIYSVGGIQAIAALTYGTQTIAAVNKIFGPGNQYVTAAKQKAFSLGTAIDMPAGPSEVLVWADKSSIPEFVAADLLSQAEHGNDSQVLLLLDDEKLISPIQEAINEQWNELPRKDIAAESLKNSSIVVLNSLNQQLDFVNAYAPEHLILSLENADEMAEKIGNAGSVFIGNFTPESAGDYASGTNHTLPTNAFARSFSGVNLDSFCKKITFQKISRQGLQTLGPVIEEMAAAEKLYGHKNAVTVRLKMINQ